MKNLRDTKDTMTMHLIDNEMCIIAQNRPYENTNLLVEYIMDYSLNKNLSDFEKRLHVIKVKVQIVTEHADGVLLYEGEKVVKFIYLNSTSSNRFSVNGRTNLKKAMHASALRHCQKMGVINSKREVQNYHFDKKVLPEHAGLER